MHTHTRNNFKIILTYIFTFISPTKFTGFHYSLEAGFIKESTM